MKSIHESFLLICILACTACSQANTANQHLGSMDRSAQEMLEEIRRSQTALNKATEQLVRMADSLVTFQQLGTDAFKIFSDSFSKKEPAPTDNIDDILGNQP
jgi:hypothetical protein